MRIFIPLINIQGDCEERCGPHEEWNECGSQLMCQRRCPGGMDGLNPGPVCNKMCYQTCQCKVGYVRRSLADDTCIPESECKSEYSI